MKEYTIRIISARDITRCIDMQESITAMAEAFRGVSAGEAVMPVRTSLAVDDHGVALFMPAYLPECGQISLKTVMAFQDNPRRGLPAIHALVQLFNAATGQPLALIDGEQLTALRTGAASGLATRLLARESADSVAVIGAGVQGRTQLEAVCCVRKIKRAYVLDLSGEAMARFAKEMSARLSIDVLPATLDILGEVEIICTATASRVPLFADELLRSGVHINAIGAFRPEMCEVPPETVKRARVYVDQRAACLQEAGDLIQPLAAGLIDANHIGRELGELLLDGGAAKGRQNDEEVTLFKSVGVAAQDLVVASLIYGRALEGNIGTEVQL